MQAQLRWAHADGISFFVYDWYYKPDPGNGPINMAHDTYLKLHDHDGVGFALLYVNQDGFVIPPDQWAEATDTWVTADFLNRDYVRINGKPLLVILDTTAFRQEWGGPGGVNAALATLQDAARRHGLPGVFVVGVRDNDWLNVQCFPRCDATDGGANGLVAEHYDALTGFSYPWIVEPVDGPRKYSDVVTAEELAWDRIAQDSPFAYIPSVMDGWDPRPWDERFEGCLLESFIRTPTVVGNFLHDAADWVQIHPKMRVEAAPSPPVVLIQSWNELGEGAYLLPTDADGYSYGQAIAQAVGIPWTPPPNHTLRVTPSSRGAVTSTPAGIACPVTCSAGFAEGFEITLTAASKPGYVVDRWAGCTADGASCSLVLVADSTARAVLTLAVQRRSLSLRLAGHLVARGRLKVLDGYAECAVHETVQIQRRRRSSWTTIGLTQTNQAGAYSVRVPNRSGTYRAHAPRDSFGEHTCLTTSSQPNASR